MIIQGKPYNSYRYDFIATGGSTFTYVVKIKDLLTYRLVINKGGLSSQGTKEYRLMAYTMNEDHELYLHELKLWIDNT